MTVVLNVSLTASFNNTYYETWEREYGHIRGLASTRYFNVLNLVRNEDAALGEDLLGDAIRNITDNVARGVTATFFDSSTNVTGDAYVTETYVFGTRLDNDASSIGDASTQDSLASLRSSILDYRRENGRTYHRLSDGNITHHLWTLTWDGELCNSPKKHGAKRVLDVGTGTGIWALDYADDHPEATVLGVDLSPIQPGYVPPNCSFEVDDVEKEWTWSTPFDFIFIRAMIASFKSWPDMIAKAYDNLEPGGYLELHDNDLPLKCDDDTMTDEYKTLKWTNLLIEGATLMGRPMTVGRDFKKMLEDAGFVDVVEKKEKWPQTPWAKDYKHKGLGEWCKESALQAIEAISMALFTRVLDWSVPETTVFCAEVRNELKRVDVHAYYEVYCVYGRKPGRESIQAPDTEQ
ncbi:putative methyltransferase tdiE [Colletotrichum viniferum]|nr:putative methyltransferase tdiE [Colletotrichum viniferum]